MFHLNRPGVRLGKKYRVTFSCEIEVTADSEKEAIEKMVDKIDAIYVLDNAKAVLKRS